MKDDVISRQDAIAALDVLCQEHRYKIPGELETYSQYNEAWQDALDRAEGAIVNLPSAQPEQRWTPVTLETLPNPNSVVVVCGKKGTWDYGTYRGWHGDIHSWWWKKNTIKHVYWWMYKDDALPEPYREE